MPTVGEQSAAGRNRLSLSLSSRRAARARQGSGFALAPTLSHHDEDADLSRSEHIQHMDMEARDEVDGADTNDLGEAPDDIDESMCTAEDAATRGRLVSAAPAVPSAALMGILDAFSNKPRTGANNGRPASTVGTSTPHRTASAQGDSLLADRRQSERVRVAAAIAASTVVSSDTKSVAVVAEATQERATSAGRSGARGATAARGEVDDSRHTNVSVHVGAASQGDRSVGSARDTVATVDADEEADGDARAKRPRLALTTEGDVGRIAARVVDHRSVTWKVFESDDSESDAVRQTVARQPLSRRRSAVNGGHHVGGGLAMIDPLAASRRLLQSLSIHRSSGHFDRRVTCVEWHPRRPDVLATASHGGDIVLWEFDADGSDNAVPRILGEGAGGSITDMKFDPTCGSESGPLTSSRVYSTSVDGTFRLRDFSSNVSRVLLNTGNWHYWYCTLALPPGSHGVAFAGDNAGNGRVAMELRMHKQKLQHAEFHPTLPHVLLTAGNDKCVRFWDVRMTRAARVTTTDPCPNVDAVVEAATLGKIEFDSPINAAYLNPAGQRLLTTTQDDRISVHDINAHITCADADSRASLVVLHPHRHFQHLAKIIATWHPRLDLFVIGRYPDPEYGSGDRRSIDCYCAKTGAIAARIKDPSFDGIVSINKFNWDGETLASGAGRSTIVWKRRGDDTNGPMGGTIASRKRGGGGAHDGDSDDGDANGGNARGKRPRTTKTAGKPAASKTNSKANSKAGDGGKGKGRA